MRTITVRQRLSSLTSQVQLTVSWIILLLDTRQLRILVPEKGWHRQTRSARRKTTRDVILRASLPVWLECVPLVLVATCDPQCGQGCNCVVYCRHNGRCRRRVRPERPRPVDVMKRNAIHQHAPRTCTSTSTKTIVRRRIRPPLAKRRKKKERKKIRERKLTQRRRHSTHRRTTPGLPRSRSPRPHRRGAGFPR